MGESGSTPNPDEGQPSASPSPPEETPARQLILIVEDNFADVLLIRRAIKGVAPGAELHVVKDGDLATRFFDELDADEGTPTLLLVILDINLPKKQGSEVLRHMRKSRKCGHAHVIAVSTSDSSRDREQMLRLGANAYFHKPSAYADFMKLGDLVKSLLTQ